MKNMAAKDSDEGADGGGFSCDFLESCNARALRGVTPIKRAIEHVATHSRFHCSNVQKVSWEKRDRGLGRLCADQTPSA